MGPLLNAGVQARFAPSGFGKLCDRAPHSLDPSFSTKLYPILHIVQAFDECILATRQDHTPIIM